MVNCFAVNCDHTSESHHCRYFRLPMEKDTEYKTWVSIIPWFICIWHNPAAIQARRLQSVNQLLWIRDDDDIGMTS